MYHNARAHARADMYDFGQINLEYGARQRPYDAGFERVHNYLRERGIDPLKYAEALGITIAPAREIIAKSRGTFAFSDDSRLALIFPHMDVGGRQIDWWSARLIETELRAVQGPSIRDLIEKKPGGKMFCPPAEAVHAYLVPLLNWSSLKRGDYVYIHESCIKAINGAMLGYWSVGLNGVRGWSARKHGLGLVEELRALPWKALELTPVIVFDSNAADNWDVQHAIGSLAAKLHEITGQRARHILLPKKSDGTHWGFDDFCVASGEAAAKAFLDSAAVAQPVEVSEIELKKIQLNSEVCIVRSLGKIADQSTGVLMSRATFTDVNYATWIAMSDEDKPVSVPRAWLMDNRRVEVEKLEYAPGAERLVEGEFLNLWKGMGIEPAAGQCDLWLELLTRQIPEERLRRWVIQWMAYPLQKLGSKMNTYLHIYGPPGTGKNAVLMPLIVIYGVNGVVMGKDQIASSFNSIYSSRQFINLDEIHGGNEGGASSIVNRIKGLVTSATLVVNTKGQPEYEVRNCANLVTTSNYSDSIKFDEGERRACVIKFEANMGQDWWNRYFSDLRSAQVYSYLLGVDMAGFDPAGAAPETVWKEQAIDATRDAMTKWARDLWDDPDSVLPDIMRAMRFLTPEQLGAAYYPNEPGRNTPGLRNQIGMRMSDLGFKRAEVKVDGAKKRFWIVRKRDEEWTGDEIRAQMKRKF